MRSSAYQPGIASNKGTSSNKGGKGRKGKGKRQGNKYNQTPDRSSSGGNNYRAAWNRNSWADSSWDNSQSRNATPTIDATPDQPSNNSSSQHFYIGSKSPREQYADNSPRGDAVRGQGASSSSNRLEFPRYSDPRPAAQSGSTSSTSSATGVGQSSRDSASPSVRELATHFESLAQQDAGDRSAADYLLNNAAGTDEDHLDLRARSASSAGPGGDRQETAFTLSGPASGPAAASSSRLVGSSSSSRAAVSGQPDEDVDRATRARSHNSVDGSSTPRLQSTLQYQQTHPKKGPAPSDRRGAEQPARTQTVYQRSILGAEASRTGSSSTSTAAPAAGSLSLPVPSLTSFVEKPSKTEQGLERVVVGQIVADPLHPPQQPFARTVEDLEEHEREYHEQQEREEKSPTAKRPRARSGASQSQKSESQSPLKDHIRGGDYFTKIFYKNPAATFFGLNQNAPRTPSVGPSREHSPQIDRPPKGKEVVADTSRLSLGRALVDAAAPVAGGSSSSSSARGETGGSPRTEKTSLPRESPSLLDRIKHFTYYDSLVGHSPAQDLAMVARKAPRHTAETLGGDILDGRSPLKTLEKQLAEATGMEQNQNATAGSRTGLESPYGAFAHRSDYHSEPEHEMFETPGIEKNLPPQSQFAAKSGNQPDDENSPRNNRSSGSREGEADQNILIARPEGHRGSGHASSSSSSSGSHSSSSIQLQRDKNPFVPPPRSNALANTPAPTQHIVTGSLEQNENVPVARGGARQGNSSPSSPESPPDDNRINLARESALHAKVEAPLSVDSLPEDHSVHMFESGAERRRSKKIAIESKVTRKAKEEANGTLWGKVRAKVESTAAMVQDYSKPIVNGFVEHVQTQFTKENIHQFGRTTYDFSEQRYQDTKAFIKKADVKKRARTCYDDGKKCCSDNSRACYDTAFGWSTSWFGGGAA